MQDALTTPTIPPSTLNEPSRDGLPPMPPGPPHEERHFIQGGIAKDVVVAAAEGLAMPFALSAALAGAGATNGTIVAAGIAAVVAASFAGAVGRYLSALEEADHYAEERRREEEESRLYPDRERWEVAAILHRYGVKGDVLRHAVEAIATDRRKWVDFMMRFELDLSEPDPHRAARAALATGVAGVTAGLVPLLPYMMAAGTGTALLVSVVLAAVALPVFGGLRAWAKGLPPVGGALRMLGIGAATAGLAWLVLRAMAA